MPLENEYGNRLSRIDGDYVVVAPRIEGTASIDPGPAARREIGTGLGRYHTVVEGFPEDFHYDDEVFPWVRDLLVEFREDGADDDRRVSSHGYVRQYDERRWQGLSSCSRMAGRCPTDPTSCSSSPTRSATT